MKTLTFLLFTALALLAAPGEAAPLGTAFTYQGRLTESGSGVTGSYDLQFTLLDAAVGGNQVVPPVVAPSVAVNNGLFTTSLDFGGSAFDGRAFWLQIGVRPSGGGGAFTPLLTLQQISPVPYAVYALSAGSGGGGGFLTSGTSAYYLTGSVGIGTSTPQSALDVHGDIGVTGAMSAGGPVSGVSSGRPFGYAVYGYDTSVNVTSSAGVFPSSAKPVGSLSNNVESKNMDEEGAGASPATVTQGNTGGVFGSSAAGVGVWGTSVTSEGVHGESRDSWGVFGSSQSSLGVFGQSTSPADGTGVLGRYDGLGHAGGGKGVFGYSSAIGVGVLGISEFGDGVSGRSNFGGKSGVYGYTEVASGYGGYFKNGAAGTGLAGESVSGTAVSAASTSGWGLYAHSQTDNGAFGQTFGDGAAGVLGRNDGPTGAGGKAVWGYAKNGATGVYGESAQGDGVWGQSNASDKSGIFGLNTTATGWGGYFVNSAGGEALHAEGNAFINGSMTVKVLTINGADVAEPFAVSTRDVPKGSVMVIDEEHPGQLKMSDRAYDQRVAGILSGANGIRAGICLSQQGFNDGGQNVALSGRVYVLADASAGAIKPGDLLTTSDTPGYAMRVADHARAQGAVIGKAMGSLPEGKGMVLVLVTLE